MRKLLYSVIVISILIFTVHKANALANPWIDCGDDIDRCAEKAGFSFPIQVKNYSARAMDGMMEITFSLDKKRTVTARKSLIYGSNADENGIKDISGDYNNYPVNKTIKLKNGVLFNIKGDKTKFYAVNFAAETGYYSFSCDKGLKIKDLEYLYKLVKKAELSKP